MTLAAQVISAARVAGLTITTAESCTGGMVATALTDIPGASQVFDRGFITYSYASKPEMLGINAEIIAKHGAVSAEVVAQMASGALAHSVADLAVAITGIAGPSINSTKPEGRVWFAVATVSSVVSNMREFGAIGRGEVRQASVEQALNLLLSAIKR